MGESISTNQRSPRISTSHKFAAPRYRLPPMALQTVQVSVEPHLSTALKDRSVGPYSSPKVSARLRYHVSNSVVFLHHAGILSKWYPLFKLFSRAEPVSIQKGNKHQLGLFFLLEACQRNAAGWSTAGWPVNTKLPLPHRHSSITRPCCSIERSHQAPCLVMHFEHSTAAGSERVEGLASLGLRAVEVIICMITRDFSVISMTSQASLSLSLSLSLLLLLLLLLLLMLWLCVLFLYELKKRTRPASSYGHVESLHV